MRLAISAASAVGLLVSATPLHAQQSALGRLEGTIREKIESRSVRAALVSLLRLDPETSHTISAKPDAHRSPILLVTYMWIGDFVRSSSRFPPSS